MAVPRSIQAVLEALERKELSAVELVRDTLERIEQTKDTLNAVVSLLLDTALEAARRVDEARANGAPLGPLAGIPVAVKDNICTGYGATTCGSRILADFRSLYDACAVERLKRAGAIVVAKTNLDEFGMGSSCEHSVFGATRNPWSLDRVAGGSSGGSAAAVAARLVPVALGSDTGGSIRQPASYCGVVGVKPSYGRVSRFGLVAYASSLDQIGVIALNVEDAARVLSVIAGHDPRDSTSVDRPVPRYGDQLACDLSGVRVGVCEDHFGEGLDEEVASGVRGAIDLLREHGATLVPIALPHMKYATACYYLIAASEASSNLARYDGVHYGHRAAGAGDIVELYAASRGEGLGPEVQRRVMLGTHALSSGYHDAYYLKALKVRTLVKRDFQQAFEQVDVIASPVAPTTAFRLGEKLGDPLSMYLTDVYTVSANLAGLCAASVPVGLDSRGLPIGMQLQAAPFAEARLLGVAHAYQRESDFHTLAPPESIST